MSALGRVKLLALVRHRHGLNWHDMLWHLMLHLVREWRLHGRRSLAGWPNLRINVLVCHVEIGIRGIPGWWSLVGLRNPSIGDVLLLLLISVIVRD